LSTPLCLGKIAVLVVVGNQQDGFVSDPCVDAAESPAGPPPIIAISVIVVTPFYEYCPFGFKDRFENGDYFIVADLIMDLMPTLTPRTIPAAFSRVRCREMLDCELGIAGFYPGNIAAPLLHDSLHDAKGARDARLPSAIPLYLHKRAYPPTNPHPAVKYWIAALVINLLYFKFSNIAIKIL
jgi:hypothetical protein